MAVFNLKSTLITNRDATPKVLTDSYVAGGDKKSAYGWVTTGSAADSVASTYKFVQIPSNARVDALKIVNDALGAGGVVKIGVFYPTFIPTGAGLAASVAGTAISDAFFASGLAVASAASMTDITNQSGTNTLDKQEQPLWQAIGLASDPGIDLDIVATVTTVLAAQGKIGVKCDYVL